MLFNEIFGAYYKTIGIILNQSKKRLSAKEKNKIILENAFEDSLLTIPKKLDSGEWGFYDAAGRTLLKHEYRLPISGLERDWFAVIAEDERFPLFAEADAPAQKSSLRSSGLYVYFDRQRSEEPFHDEEYRTHFKTLCDKIRRKAPVRATFINRYGTQRTIDCLPLKIEYSFHEDRFRLVGETTSGRQLTVNMDSIQKMEDSATVLEEYLLQGQGSCLKKQIKLVLTDERDTLDRAMRQFSDLEKECRKLSGNKYDVTINYRQEDEMEIIIRILSFGKSLMVYEPESVVDEIKHRIEKQKQLTPAEE